METAPTPKLWLLETARFFAAIVAVILACGVIWGLLLLGGIE
jgi:hypothetical protein